MDGLGKLFRTREEALAHASVLARELAKDKGWVGFTISLTNDNGGMVAQIPVP
jgi:predicted DNA-binding transcriptional regulator